MDQAFMGNGATTFLWLDNWNPLGPLFYIFGDIIVFNLGRSLHTKVESVFQNNSWCWPRRGNLVTKEIMDNIPCTSFLIHLG